VTLEAVLLEDVWRRGRRSRGAGRWLHGGSECGRTCPR
jgi:hypothetical protein